MLKIEWDIKECLARVENKSLNTQVKKSFYIIWNRFEVIFQLSNDFMHVQRIIHQNLSVIFAFLKGSKPTFIITIVDTKATKEKRFMIEVKEAWYQIQQHFDQSQQKIVYSYQKRIPDKRLFYLPFYLYYSFEGKDYKHFSIHKDWLSWKYIIMVSHK